MKAYSIPALIIASICLTIAISDSLAWVRRNRRRSDAAFILICLGGASFCLFCAGEYNVDDPLQSLFWLKGETIASTLSGFALLWFISERTKLVKRPYFWSCLAWTALAVLSQLVDLGELAWVASRPFTLRVELPFGLDFVYRELERGPILVAITSIGFLYELYLLGVVLRFRRQGDRGESSVLLAALGFILAAQVLDFLIGIGLVRFVFLLEYAWLATILVVGLQRSNDFIEAAITRKALEQTDARLKRSEATLATVIDSTDDPICSVDAASFGLLTFNRAFAELLAEARGLDPQPGLSLEAVFPEPGERAFWEKAFGDALRDKACSFERVLGSRERTFAVSVHALALGGAVFGLSVFAQDVTERNQAKERITRALAEKEILLREVFHRTKNNMSAIIALLRLQSAELGDRRLAAAFAASVDRIQSMSLAHDKLYKGDLGRVDLKAYIAELVGKLASGRAAPGTRPSLKLDLDSVLVGVDTAMDCGLVANELVTNAIEHAYPDGQGGEIRVSLKRGGGGEIRLAVSDDGAGPPAGFDPARDGRLGLRLARSVARGKLRAELRLGPGPGFSWELTFRDQAERARGEGA